MRRIVKIIISALAVLIILYTVINLWDAKLNPNAYTSADLPDASFDRSNGFYILWGLAELHMNYSAERNVTDILKELDSYKTHDPCSGKPYAWNKKKGILYSIGTDRVDNEGADNPHTWTDTDFAIPVVLKTETTK